MECMESQKKAKYCLSGGGSMSLMTGWGFSAINKTQKAIEPMTKQ